MNTKRILLCMAVVTAAGLMAASAQSGGSFTLNWNTRDGGGGECRSGITLTGGPKFALSGTVGQPDAGTGVAGTYTLQGGFVPAFQKTVGPALKFTASGSTLLISWPANSCRGFHLEAGANAAGGQWVDLGEGIVFGTERLVAVSQSSGHGFFRLRKDCPK